MKYKQDGWYIAGIILTAISIVVIAVTMVFMYFGNNVAIVYCFSAMPVLAFGILLAQSVKRRYEEADAENGEPLPIFWRVRYAYHNLKILVITHDVWRGVLIAVASALLATTIVLGGLCGYWAFAKDSVKKDPKYLNFSSAYNSSYEQWQEARKNGDKSAQAEHFECMTQAKDSMYKYEIRMDNYQEKISSTWPWAVGCLASTAFSATVMLAYKKHKKSQNI